MKKIINYIIILSLSLSVFSSCDKENKETEINSNETKQKFTAEDNDFLYELKNYNGPDFFTVSDNGNLYFLNTGMNKIDIYDLNGEKLEETKSISYSGTLNSGVAIFNNILYFSYCPIIFDVEKNQLEPPETSEIYSINLDTNKQEKVIVIEGMVDISKVIPYDNKLYLFGKDNELEKNTVNSNEFDYNGECVKSLDLESGKIETAFSSDKMPIMIAENEKNGITLLAYNEDNGYYFRNLNSEEIIINNNEKFLFNLNKSINFNFEFYDDSNIIYTQDKYLYYSPIDGSSNPKEILNNINSYGYVIINLTGYALKSGYFYLNTNDGIRRIFINELLNRTILDIAYTSGYSINVPPPFLDDLGFGINFKMVPYDEFALSVLSLDKNYDFYYLNSKNDVSYNIYKKGAFYSLNDVPYVKEYIDACFPYVKDTAYNENGDIWMIPVNLTTDVMTYNEPLCAEYGIDAESIKSLEEHAEVMSKIKEMDLKIELQLSFGQYLYKYFNQLITANNGFNRDAFKKMALFFYEDLNFIKTNWIVERYLGNGLEPDDYMIKIGNSIIENSRGIFIIDSLASFDGFDYLENVLGYNDFSEEEFWENANALKDIRGTKYNYTGNHYRMFPPIEDVSINDVSMSLMIINPNSKNLEQTLDYISKFCENKLKSENSFMLKDKSTYTDKHFINEIYNILNYEGNYISFSLEAELIYPDITKYLGDEITLDEYLDRLEYKLNAYLNE